MGEMLSHWTGHLETKLSWLESIELDMVVQFYNLNTQKAEAGGSWVQGQSELYS